MKFTIIGPVYPFRGGIAHYTYYLHQALQEYGHQTQVISFRRQYPGWLYPGKNDRDPSKLILTSNAQFLIDSLFPWSWFKTVRAIASWAPNLIVIQWWTTFWGIPFAIINKKLNNLGHKVVYLIHNVLPHEERSWDILLARYSLSNGNAFIVQTPREQYRLKKLIPEAKHFLCYHPSYPMFSNKKLTKSEARNTLKQPEDVPLLLFFGIVRPYKGLRILLEALGELKREGLRPNLIIAGEFWENIKDYLKLIGNLGLNEQITIENRYIPNEEVELFFSAADFMVVPYTSGSQSGAASLATSFGLPLIVSDHIARGIDHSKLNKILIVPSGNIQALVNAIRSLLEEPNIIQERSSTNWGDWICLVQSLEKCIEL